jgi:HSP20 family protein
LSFWNIRPYRSDDVADWFSIFFRTCTPSKEAWRSSDIENIFREFDDIEWQIEEGVLSIEQQFEYTLCSDTPNRLPRKCKKKPKGAKKRKARQLAYDYPATNVVPNSRAQVKEFGNIESFGSDGNDYHNDNSIDSDDTFEFQVTSYKREPLLVDIIRTPKQVKIVVEMPLVNKKDIKVKAYDGYVKLSAASTQGGKYHRTIDIPSNVDLGSGKSTYRNGILEIVFSKRKRDFKAE